MIEDAGIADDDVERAWRLTRAAYDDPEFEGLEIDDTRAIIDISGRHVHVAFRGTATPLIERMSRIGSGPCVPRKESV